MAPLRTRVELTDLPAPDRIRPQQRTIDTYAAPERPPKDDDAMRLAQALQGFSSVLAGFARQGTKPDQDPRVAEAYRVISSSQDPQMIQGLQQGTLPYMNV